MENKKSEKERKEKKRSNRDIQEVYGKERSLPM